MHTLIAVATITGAGFCFMLANLVMKTMGARRRYQQSPSLFLQQAPISRLRH
ncbi:hypothetical protein [Pararhizobium sp. DWP1-1-3]|uniref:hypothetical protein n=1 Tax=Pararhizobium sp. DWP1-1-3 TaxID=2804652 RepID=UPI003CF2387F